MVRKAKQTPAVSHETGDERSNHYSFPATHSREASNKLITIFIGILTMVGIIQVWAYVQQERAQLVVNHIQFSEQPLQAGKQIYIGVDVVNWGDTTASIKNFSLAIAKSLVETPNYSPMRRAFSPIPPKGTMTKILSNKELVLDEAQVQRLEGGDEELFVLGNIEYEDSFSLRGLFSRRLGFCFVYAPRRLTENTSPFLECDDPKYLYSR